MPTGTEMQSEALNACFVLAMSQRCRYVDGGMTMHTGGLAVAFTNLRVRSSYCVLTRMPESLRALAVRVEQALVHGRRAAVPWDLVVLDDWLRDPAYEQILTDRGLRCAGTIIGMSATVLAPPRRPSPALRLTSVTSPEELDVFAAINNDAYGYGASLGTALYEHYFRAPHCRAVIGRMDGVPVACAASFPTEYGTYLGGVATVEKYRGRGFGEAVAREAIGIATPQGSLSPAILFTGRKRSAFYEPLGFVPRATLRVYRTE